MRILHVIASLAESRGGPPRSVVGLSESLALLGCDVEICTLDTTEQFGPNIECKVPSVEVHSFPCRILPSLRLVWPKQFYSSLRDIAEAADLVHSHGVWLPVNRDAARVARDLAIPHVISTRGNLHPSCLSRSSLKKRVARSLFVDRSLRSSSCVHATVAEEALDIRAFGLMNPIAVVPNGVAISTIACRAMAAEVVRRNWPQLFGKKLLLFMSRIHPHKGLRSLVEVWARLHKCYGDWHLVIAGPDEIGFRAEIERMVASNGALVQTTFLPPLYGERKWSLLAYSQVFVLPSRSENFGIAIAEALASGKPVVTTKGAPWKEIETRNCGWWIDIGVEALVVALKEALESSDSQRQEMGSRGRALMIERYSWQRIGREMLGVYQWLLGETEKPGCVRTN